MTENYSKQPSPDGIVFETHPKNKLFQDLTGRRFQHLTVLGFAGRQNADMCWWLQCDCGRRVKRRASHFKYGFMISCGCMRSAIAIATHTTHGMSKTSEFKIWTGIKNRCLNPLGQDWDLYGGRGITVCERWVESFENFYADMGPRPSCKHSIDRIDANGNYEPSNCRWATAFDQAGNTRRSVLIERYGKRQCVSAWERELGFSRSTLRQRLDAGWSVDRAFTENVKPKLPSQTASTARHA